MVILSSNSSDSTSLNWRSTNLVFKSDSSALNDSVLALAVSSLLIAFCFRANFSISSYRLIFDSASATNSLFSRSPPHFTPAQEEGSGGEKHLSLSDFLAITLSPTFSRLHPVATFVSLSPVRHSTTHLRLLSLYCTVLSIHYQPSSAGQ